MAALMVTTLMVNAVPLWLSFDRAPRKNMYIHSHSVSARRVALWRWRTYGMILTTVTHMGDTIAPHERIEIMVMTTAWGIVWFMIGIGGLGYAYVHGWLD